MSQRENKPFALRVRLVSSLFFMGLVGVGVRVWFLQTTRHDELSRLSRDEYLKDLQIPAERGNIYDRNGEQLARSINVPSVYANPRKFNDPREAARQIAKALDLDLHTVYRRLASDRVFVWLKRQVNPKERERVEALNLQGVSVTYEPRRFYPNRELAAHLLGFCGIDANGLEGVERELDSTLAGEPQVIEAMRDALGNAILPSGIDTDEARGGDVNLTIDLRLQHAAQRALARVVEETRARAATAIILDARNPDVLAMAVEPVFNPNEPGSASADVLRNRTVTDMFEPGSTVKPLVMAAALEADAVEPTEKIFCENGAYTIGNHIIRDSKAHGWLSLGDIIAFSSNPGAAKIGEALGSQKLYAALNAYGFGRRTGIELPGETAGMLRPAASWSQVGIATISFGHGVAVNALQLAAAYRVLANGGVYIAPSLLSDGARARSNRVLSASTVAKVIPMMERVVSSEGTGWRASVPGYRVAGKTGTANKVDAVTGGYSADRFVAVFAGFLPANDPAVVIVVAVDEPQDVHSGGAVAAPVFAEIGEATMRYLGVVPTQSLMTATAKPVAMLEELDTIVEPPSVPTKNGIPSFVGLTARAALARFVEAGVGFDLEMQGSGRVVAQKPLPGTPRDGVRRITLVMGNGG
ncbi:MAG: hypothetical protein A2289_22440 [Deltaproteobacteria bacterium RIFOXYA12_FULL_58_15]|nr:MAG: hypothetical protein A2289_22440 [Deltaproteobacteria bacterium RIFOXYA12_FULL_58_15]